MEFDKNDYREAVKAAMNQSGLYGQSRSPVDLQDGMDSQKN